MQVYEIKKPESFSRVARALDRIGSFDKPIAKSGKRVEVKPKPKPVVKPSFQAVGREKHTPFTLYHSKDRTKQLCYDHTRMSRLPWVAMPKQVHQRLILDSPYKHLRSTSFKSRNTSQSPSAADPQAHQQQQQMNQSFHISKTLDFNIQQNHDSPRRNYIRKPCYQGTPQNQQCGRFLSLRNTQRISQHSAQPYYAGRAHDFNSYTNRKPGPSMQQNAPTFDVLRSDFSKIRKGWVDSANLQFSRFRDRITTRLDRSDAQWFTKLDYAKKFDLVEERGMSARIDTQSRKPNLVPTPYPFRTSMEMVPREVLLSDRKELRAG